MCPAYYGWLCETGGKINMSEQIYYDEINRINTLLNEYYKNYQKNYLNINEDFNENLKIKNNIKDLIIEIRNNTSLTENNKQLIINELLKLLAENTGCVEDCKISEVILDELKDRKIIDKNNIEYYYFNENTGRWI
jgi:6-pyruvoyl-tetrahydropterin synthase